MSRVFLDNHKYFLSHMALPSLLSNRLLPRFRPLCCLHSSSFITLLPFKWTRSRIYWWIFHFIGQGIFLYSHPIVFLIVIIKFISNNCKFDLLIAPYYFHPSSPVISSLTYAFLPPWSCQILQWPGPLVTAKFAQFWPWSISCIHSRRRPTFSRYQISSKTVEETQSRNINHTGSDLHIGVLKED